MKILHEMLFPFSLQTTNFAMPSLKSSRTTLKALPLRRGAYSKYDSEQGELRDNAPEGLHENVRDGGVMSQLESLHMTHRRMSYLFLPALVLLPVYALVVAHPIDQVAEVFIAHGFAFVVSVLSLLLAHRSLNAAFELAQATVHLSDLSTTDIVTGGHNRLYVERTLEVESARTMRYGHALSLLMFDLDNFKTVNDTCGHAAGDDVLREVWQSALHAVREMDTVGRFGGDEFLIVLPETGSREAHALALRLQREVQERLGARFGDTAPQGRVTLSIGIATWAGDEKLNIGRLMACADEHLYEAKRAGKDQIVSGRV